MRVLKIAALMGVGVSLAACASAPTGRDSAAVVHERLLTLDTHLDTPANFLRPQGWSIMDRHPPTDSKVDYPRMVEGGLDGGFWALYTPQGPRTPEGFAAARARATATAANIDKMAAEHPNEFELAYRSEDAARIVATHKRVVFKSIENSYPLGLDVNAVDEFYKLGVRIIGPVHSTNNDWADSSTDAAGAEWHGLSPRGEEMVRHANRLGMVLDASHASDETFYDLIALSKTPIILTHSGCRAVFNHPRNITDEMLKKLAASGGVIQMNSLYSGPVPPVSAERTKALADLLAKYGPRNQVKGDQLIAMNAELAAINAQFPAPTASFEDYMAQILHALAVVGPDHVGMGADWDGGGGVSGLEDISMLPKITARLLQAGYTERDLQKIWGGNVLRLLKKAEDEAAREAKAG
jgi:membrane dipeptidase